ncbi:hypothetical protein [Deinococcus rufus]|uniref:Uncharacterized protein n=1 Tax=Deinococcus rufus TaxID=2136097 RepID=A0ABV7ZB32_9DEIO
MGLSTDQRLEALYSLTADTLGLAPAAYQRRVGLWGHLSRQRMATTPGLTPAQTDAFVDVLALRAWQAVLIGQADKFRAEGDITTERNMQIRLDEIRGWISSAETAAGLTEGPTSVSSNPAPEFAAWGIDG